MQNLKSRFKGKINSKTFYFLLVFLSFEFLFLNLDKAEASALSLSLDPPIIEINAIPPSNKTSDLKIKNLSDNQTTLQIQIKPFKAKSEGGQPEYLNLEDFPILNNVKILENEVPVENIVLAPAQEKNLTLDINIPKDINISDYYFSIIFISKNSLSPTSTSSLNQIGIASNVLLSVGPPETPKAILEEFSSDTLFAKGPVPFAIKIKNQGNHFIKSKGQIIIKNMFGQSIGRIDLPAMNILSNSSRIIPNTSWRESFLLGFYTATLSLSLSDSGPILIKSIRFFAFPLESALVIVIAAAIITVIRKKIEHRYNVKHN